MDYVRKTYIEFLFSLGTDYSKEYLTQEVNTRDVSNIEMPKIPHDMSKIRIPNTAFGFKFFDIISVVVDVDGKKVKLSSEPIKVSPTHYYGGKVYTVAELKREFPNERDLIENAQRTGRKAIKCRTGNWRLLEETDLLVEGD